MGVVNYLTVNGEILSETRNGVEHDYMPDPLSSTAALLDSSGITDTFSYWPYGEVRSHTGSSTTPFQYVSTLGYYVRARYLQPEYARWQTVDPLWPRQKAYGYADEGPTWRVDPSGLMDCIQYLCGIPKKIEDKLNDAIKDCVKESGGDIDALVKCLKKLGGDFWDTIGKVTDDAAWDYLACLFGSVYDGGVPDQDPCSPPGECHNCCYGKANACQIRCVTETSWWDPFHIKPAICMMKCDMEVKKCMVGCV